MRGKGSDSTTIIRKRHIAGVVILLIATVMTVVFLLQSFFKAPLASEHITMSGRTVCLPHKASGPSTLECATGLRGDDGRYYALSGYEPGQLPINAMVEVTGTLHEPAPNSIYDIAGTIEIEVSSTK